MGSPGEDGDKGDPGPPGEKGFKGSRGETVSGFTDTLTAILRHENFVEMSQKSDRLCGLVVKVLGYRSEGPGFYSRHYQKKK
jgi:hypothetical protein